MIFSKPTTAIILKINGNFLGCVLFGLFAWWFWPTEPLDWGYAPIAIMCAVLSCMSLFRAIRRIFAVRERIRAVGNYVADTREPAPARLADEDALDRAGMR